MEWLEDEWDELQKKLEEDASGMREEMIEYFNGLITGEDDLGDYLHGDYTTFKDRIKILTTD